MSDKQFRTDMLAVMNSIGRCDAQKLATEMGADLGRVKCALKRLVETGEVHREQTPGSLTFVTRSRRIRQFVARAEPPARRVEVEVVRVRPRLGVMR